MAGRTGVDRSGSTGTSRRTVLACGLSAVLGTAGCGGTGAAARSSGGDLVVGACLDLTGAGSLIGTAARRGLQIILDQRNGPGGTADGAGRTIRLVVQDTASDPPTAATIAQRLISTVRVSGLIVGAGVGVANALVPVTEQSEVPMLATVSPGDVTAPTAQRRFLFTLGPDATDVAMMLVAAAHDRDVRRIGILASDDAHGDAGVAAVTAAVHGRSGISLTRTVRLPAGATDYHAPAATVAGTYPRPDAIVVWSMAPASGLAARALHAIGYHGMLLFDAGAASDDSLSAANRTAMEGGYLVSPFLLSGSPLAVTTPVAAAQRDFYARYVRRYGSFSGLSVYAADALGLLAAATLTTGSTDRQAVQGWLASARFDGIAGSYAFSAGSHGGVRRDALRLFRIERSGWVQLT